MVDKELIEAFIQHPALVKVEMASLQVLPKLGVIGPLLVEFILSHKKRKLAEIDEIQSNLTELINDLENQNLVTKISITPYQKLDTNNLSKLRDEFPKFVASKQANYQFDNNVINPFIKKFGEALKKLEEKTEELLQRAKTIFSFCRPEVIEEDYDLTEIDFSAFQFTSHNVFQFAQIVTKFKSLQIVYIQNADNEEVFVHTFFKLIDSVPTLKNLDFRNKGFFSEDSVNVTTLIESLKRNKSLTSLCLLNCGITHKIFQTIVREISDYNLTLQEYSLLRSGF